MVNLKPTHPMKTKLILIASSILLAACDKNHQQTPQAENSKQSEVAADQRLLTTDIPRAVIEGTPRPIRIPGVNDQATTSTATPGTEGVMLTTQRELTSPPVVTQPRFSPPPIADERYQQLTDNLWQQTMEAPLSTFSVDVDTASYANVRRMIRDGEPVQRDAVRLEELVNYFDYAYPAPTGPHPLAVNIQNAACPWNSDHQLVRVALKGKEIERKERPAANLVFLLDVSGSMNHPRKFPLVVQSLEMLVEELNADDSLAIVVYAGAQGLALPSTACDSNGRETITTAMRNLHAGGATNGGAGIQLAYQVAIEHFKDGGINRVILATDGDFNVGVTGQNQLVDLVAEKAEAKVDLTVVSVGTGNLNDAMLEEITNRGNGTYHYIDSLQEARRVFLDKMMGTLVTIAKDVKVQVEFNPAVVRNYRLLGYANRMLRKEDFANDRIDAGDIGSGHTVTAFYEVETTWSPMTTNDEVLRYAVNRKEAAAQPIHDENSEWLTVKLRYKQPGGEVSAKVEYPYAGSPREFASSDEDFRFASTVAMASMLMRDHEDVQSFDFSQVSALAKQALGGDPHGQRSEFVQLLDLLSSRTQQAIRD